MQTTGIEVPGGAIPTIVLGPDHASRVPGLVVVPSVFGPAPDLVRRLSRFAERALVALPDPFWRVGGGVVPYGDLEAVGTRMQGFDLAACSADLQAVVAWTRERCNGRVAGLGICFGGPFVLRFAGQGDLDGVVTWHGSRMENFLKRARETTCPLRLHFGADDPITPPAAIEAIREAFAGHPDASIVVHPGAVHGFSHDGDAYDEGACKAGLDAVDEILGVLA
jgi:carboxymethylenebutenolidase